MRECGQGEVIIFSIMHNAEAIHRGALYLFPQQPFLKLLGIEFGFATTTILAAFHSNGLTR